VSFLTTLFFIPVMEPLTIGTALPGLLISSVKPIRLLKLFTTSPDVPESMTVMLDHLVSISTALNQLNPFLRDLSTMLEGHGLVNPQYLVVPLTACVITISQLERLIDTIRTDPKRSSRLYARLEEISSLDYMNSSLPDEDVIWRAENSEAYISSRQSGNGTEKEVTGLAILDDGLDWTNLADYDEEIMTSHDGEDRISLFNKQKWDKEQGGHMVKILRICREMLELLTDTFLVYAYHPGFNPCLTNSKSTSIADTAIPKLSELASQILNDETLKTAHNVETFESQIAPLENTDWPSRKSQSKNAARRNLQLASQLYLRGPPPSDSSISSPTQNPTPLNVAQLPIPILPSSIANRAWYRFPLPYADPHNTTYHITVKSLSGKVETLKISMWTTCLDVKLVIQKTQGPLLHQQYLVCEPDNRWLPEDVVLSQRGVREGSRIHVLLPFWGRGRM